METFGVRDLQRFKHSREESKIDTSKPSDTSSLATKEPMFPPPKITT